MSASEAVQLGEPRRRVLVVDDSAFMRRLVSDVVQSSGEFEVVGTARDGHDALRQVVALDPDLITLDVDMPELDGLAALECIMRDHPRPVVMLSAGGSDGGADATLRALERGAVDFVRKPSGAISLDLESVGEQLLDALRAASTVTQFDRPVAMERIEAAVTVAAPADAKPSPALGTLSHVICIAASTGGPAALAQLVPALPAWTDAAVLVVQHMPVGFTASFARRLDAASRLTVHEAVHGEPVRAGHVYVAPGGWHLRVAGTAERPVLQLDDAAPLWGVRPAADLLFASAAETLGARCIGVVLTGMGRDGAEGLKAIRQMGGGALVQDAYSSIVPGMPEAARRTAGADDVVALHRMAHAIAEQVVRRAPGAAA
jgi:two-component system chemotaxis response regulator CheB